jgi:stringent starvation protein B
MDSTSTRPYLIRAIFEWCVDQGFTPYLVVLVDERVTAPKEFVKNGEIILNISPDATGGLKLGNEWIEFKARFGGVARDILVPVDQVIAVYARENGQGMSFPKPSGAKSIAKNAADIRREPGSESHGEERNASSAAPIIDKPPTLQMVFSSDKSIEPAMPKPPSLGSDGGEEPTPPSSGGGNLKSHLKRIK